MRPVRTLASIMLVAAGCSSHSDTGQSDNAITFAAPDANAAAPVPVYRDPASARSIEQPAPADEPIPTETGTPPSWAGTYATSQSACASAPWRFNGVVVLPPDGRVCRIGQTSAPGSDKVTLIVSCASKAGATNELWKMTTQRSGLSIDRNNNGVRDHLTLSRCSR